MRNMTSEREDEAATELPHGNVPKSFLTFVAEQQSGTVAAELSEKLRDLTEAIEMHFDKFRGKVTGEISLKFKLVLEGGAYRVITEYTVKPPKAPVGNTIMWLGRDGHLQARDPRQLAMPFETVRPHA
jgi:hypothetical protein